MKEIVHGRIVGMPTHLRCVHVDDSKLGAHPHKPLFHAVLHVSASRCGCQCLALAGEMSKSSLNALEYALCLQVSFFRTVPVSGLLCYKVKMKAMEIGVTDASADNLRRVGFPEKMSRADDV